MSNSAINQTRHEVAETFAHEMNKYKRPTVLSALATAIFLLLFFVPYVSDLQNTPCWEWESPHTANIDWPPESAEYPNYQGYGWEAHPHKFTYWCVLYLHGHGVSATGFKFMSLMGCIFTFVFLVQFFLPFYNEMRLRDISLAIPSDIAGRIVKAHESVAPFLARVSEKIMRPGVFKRMLALYIKFDKLPTENLRQQLDQAGVWNSHSQWYGKGRTIEEGVMLAIYNSRLGKEAVEIELEKETYRQAEFQAAAAASIKSRVVEEQKKKSAEDRLSQLRGNKVKWSVKLNRFNGMCRVYATDSILDKVLVYLEAGEYSIELKDSANRGKQINAVASSSSEPISIGDLNKLRLNAQMVELIVTNRVGQQARVGFWM